MAKEMTFQTEINQLLDLMIHSLYSNKEIFLRELISNASDALDKLQYLTLVDDKFKKLKFDPKITISFDEKKHKITISDNGIGMSEDDMIENLGTIAKSGTKNFISQLSGDKKRDSALIGQFGVGFYSSFMVADKVSVVSKKAGEEKAYSWISDGSGKYEISECKKDEHGTEIVLFLNSEESSFASRWKIESLVKKYSDHIPFPIYLNYTQKEREDKNDEKSKERDVEKRDKINDDSAPWKKNKKE